MRSRARRLSVASLARLSPLIPSQKLIVASRQIAHGQNPSCIFRPAKVHHVRQLAIRPADAPHPGIFIIRDNLGENLCRFAVVQSVGVRHPDTWSNHHGDCVSR
jgi:hypothetical protein